LILNILQEHTVIIAILHRGKRGRRSQVIQWTGASKSWQHNHFLFTWVNHCRIDWGVHIWDWWSDLAVWEAVY